MYFPKVDLEAALKREPCPHCGMAWMRPIDFTDSCLTVECSGKRCGWTGHADLPRLKKRVIYLDTSTVSLIARAPTRGSRGEPWMRLRTALKSAIADHSVCCVASSITRIEIEQAREAESIVSVMDELTFARLRDPWAIRRRQIARALDAFLQERPQSDAMKTDPEDAFEENPHRWLPQLSITNHIRYPREYVESLREIKESGGRTLVSLHDEYADKGMTFDEIRVHEASSFGDLKVWMRRDFESLIQRVMQLERVDGSIAELRVRAFLKSEHLRSIPWVAVASRLHAQIAMKSRGDLGREAEGSDLDDIQQIATYLPYVDILVVDRFFLDLCNERRVGLTRLFDTGLRRIGDSTIEDFIRELQEFARDLPQVQLTRRICDAIQAGGHWQEENQRMAAAIRRLRQTPRSKQADC
jgi:hypothetical protein